MLVSFFTYYDVTCRELMTLHVRVMSKAVDHFVITESSHTHAGQPAPQGLRRTIESQLPDLQHRITVINLDIPKTTDLEIKDIDYLNTHELYSTRLINQGNLDNVRARTRERLQKDSLLQLLQSFDDDTVFIHSDCDEIMDPRHVEYLSWVCRRHPEVVIKVPLVYLQGRADLRAHDKRTGVPVPWAGGMFLAMKSHFHTATPTQIRSNNQNPWPVQYITQDNRIVEDMGWHFSWMGGVQQRLDKSRNFAHYRDDLSFLATNSYDDPLHQTFLRDLPLEPGSVPPSGDVNHVLHSYDTRCLPEEIWQDHLIRRYLLPEPQSALLV